MPKFIKYPIYFFLILIALFTIKPLTDTYQNEVKPLFKGYTKATGQNTDDMMRHQDEIISHDLMMYVHYYTDARLSLLNKTYFKCIENENVFDIGCMKNIKESLLQNDKCAWTFFGYSPIAKHKNYYLVNIKEKACGSMIERFNSHYLFDYDGEKLKISETILAGRYPERPISFYKISDWGFEYITTGCYHGADSCRGQRADWLEFKFKNEKS